MTPLLTLAAWSRRTTIGEWRIHFLDSGNGGNPLVLVHGWSGCAAQWGPVIARTWRDRRVIAIDLPGHGASDQPRADYTMTMLARAVDAVLQEAGVAQATLVGHSLSVALVREVEHRYPQRVAALVLIDGTYWDGTTQAGIDRATAANVDYARRLADPAQHRALATAAIHTMFAARTPDPLRRHLLQTMLRTAPHVAGSTMLELARSRAWTFGPSRVPARALMADTRGNRALEPFVRRMFPGLRDFTLWPGAGHFPHLENPDAFTTWLRRK